VLIDLSAEQGEVRVTRPIRWTAEYTCTVLERDEWGNAVMGKEKCRCPVNVNFL